MSDAPRSPLPPVPLPVEEIDRKLKWRSVAIVVFVLTLIALAVVAAGSFAPGRIVHGVPEGADARAAVERVHGRVAFDTSPFRFESALLGDPDGDPPAGRAALDSASAALERALARRPLDARIHAALAGLDLASGRLGFAEVRYLRAASLTSRYPEARLGAGVALALRAERSADELERRALRLRAIGQLLDVRPDEPGFAAARFDRAWLLASVGRGAEALAEARAVIAEDSTSASARALLAHLAEPAP